MVDSKPRRLKMCKQTICRYFLKKLCWEYFGVSDTFDYKKMIEILNTPEVRLWSRTRRSSRHTYVIYRIGYFDTTPRIVNMYGDVANHVAEKHFQYGAIWRTV